MSHVDEGELTAYADGAYRVDDPVALRIGAHLSMCDNCRTRLEQAHELRDRAAQILGYATPARMQAPSFEALQAQLIVPSRPPRRTIPLAWAATIIMALGLGWFGRGAWQNPPASRDMAMQEAAPAAPPPAGAPADHAAPAPSPAASVESSARPPAPVSTRVAAAEAPRTARIGAAANTGGRVADAAVGEAAGAPAPVAAAPPPSAALSVTRERAARAREDQFMSAAEAEQRGISVPRIPELPIARIAVQDAQTIVEQTLPDGKLITLTVTDEAVQSRDMAVTRQAAAPQKAEARREVAPSVTVSMNGKHISIAGDLPADSLRALAAKIK